MSSIRRALLLVVAIAVPSCLVTEDAPTPPEPTAQPAAEPAASSKTTSSSSCDKVQICHVPPGNPSARHELVVGSSAVPAHIAHGDYLGTCAPLRVCTPGTSSSCYTGPASTEGVGICAAGTRACNAAGDGYRTCTGSVVPRTEVCNNRLDDDCDGIVDENCVCPANRSTSCYVGPPGTEGIGTCRHGSQVCDANGTSWGECIGSLGPVDELCGDQLDNNCDGAIDEGCVCAPGAIVTCYIGPPETDGVGVCHRGQRTCETSGQGYSACEGMVLPGLEQCDNGLDDNCDGQTDEGCSTSTTEVCGDGLDNDHDGVVDGCIGDRAWDDLDRDGTQDPGEPGMAGVIFLLRNGAGVALDLQVSDAGGHYQFANVRAGAYYIEVATPADYSVTALDHGDDATDSDFDGEELRTTTFTFTTGNDTSRDCGVASNQHG